MCGKEFKRLTRGLCHADYQKFRREMDKLSTPEQDALEELAIAQGKLLPSKQGRRPEVHNVFADFAEQIRRKSKEALQPKSLPVSEEPLSPEMEAAAKKDAEELIRQMEAAKKKKDKSNTPKQSESS